MPDESRVGAADVAFIFDLDGVIIDSMPFHYRAWEEAFNKVGVTLTKEEIYEREGEKREITAREVFRHHKGVYPAARVVESIIRTKEEIYKSIFEIRLLPGVVDLLELLTSRKVKLGLTTGSTSLSFDFQHQKDLLEKFDAIVAGEEAINCKPAPDPYLLTVEKLNVPADSCFVIENSPLGVISALAANLTCIAVIGTSPLPAEALKRIGAHYIFTNLNELRDTLLTDHFTEGPSHH
jgi:beta-phosphoglucomutase